jgi:hypothetical protein
MSFLDDSDARHALSQGEFEGVARIRIILSLVFLTLFSIPSFAGEYRAYDIESLHIMLDSNWAQIGAPGYLPVRFDITNLAADARVIEIDATETHFFDPSRHGGYRPGFFGGGAGEMGRADLRQTVRLKRGDRVKLTMNVPVFADTENINFQMREGGKPLQGFSSFVTIQSGRPLGETAVLFVTNPTSSLGVQALGWTRPVPPGRFALYVPGAPGAPTPSTPRMDFFLDPERLPTSWLGFTTLRAVTIGPSECKDLSPAQQDALLTWTANGGDLLLVDGAAESILPPTQRPVGPAGSPGTLPYFFGHIHLLKSADITARGFVDTLNQVNGVTELDDWALPANRAQDWGWMGDRGFRIPIKDAGAVPSRAYLAILALFLALIGPVNYVYLWRKRRQVLMVVTVPLLSLLFIFLLTVYGILLEGFGVRTRAITFTMLDQDSKRAATRASVSMYPGGVAPSGGIAFASDAAVFPLGTDGFGARSPLSIDWTSEQRFQSGLLQARSPGNFEQIDFQPARQRLSFERNGAELGVVNGLGKPVQKLFYKEGGQIYSLTAELPSGDRGSLKVQSIKGAEVFAEGLRNSPLSAKKFQKIVDGLPDASYLAVLQSSPFWTPNVARSQEDGSFHLVMGYMGRQP